MRRPTKYFLLFLVFLALASGSGVGLAFLLWVQPLRQALEASEEERGRTAQSLQGSEKSRAEVSDLVLKANVRTADMVKKQAEIQGDPNLAALWTDHFRRAENAFTKAIENDPKPPLPYVLRAWSRQAQQLRRLVDDLFDVIRVNTGKVNLNKEAVQLGTVIHQAAETVRPLVESRKHELSVSLPKEPIWHGTSLPSTSFRTGKSDRTR